jgi:hypothetical protein
VFQKFIEPKRCFTLKRDSDICDSYLPSHIFTVNETELSDGRALQNLYRYYTSRPVFMHRPRRQISRGGILKKKSRLKYGMWEKKVVHEREI